MSSTLNKTRKILALALLMACIATPGLAQKDDRPYVSLDGGISFLQDVHASSLSPVVPASAHLEFDPGFRLDAAFGYYLRRGGLVSYHGFFANLDIAAELSAGFVYNQGQSQTEIGLGTSAGSLDLYQVPVLANVIFRAPLTEKLTVGVGGGLGALVAILDANGSTESALLFGWQAIANLNYDLTDNLSAGLTYKLLGTGDGKYSDLGVETGGMLSHFMGLTAQWRF